jgi:exonuclease III
VKISTWNVNGIHARFTFARDAVRITRHSAEETHGQAPSESDVAAAFA